MPPNLIDAMQSRADLLFLVCTALAGYVLSVRISQPPRPVASPGREPRISSVTRRDAPAIVVSFHGEWDPALFRGLNISGPAELPRAANFHAAPMGVPDSACDDGKTNLTLDWEEGWVPECEAGPLVAPPIPSRIDCQRALPDNIPLAHVCMNETIEYSPGIPTYGHHRPLWPVYGSYAYLPPQRWLHSVEHGAVVLLYHPCADFDDRRKLTRLVRRCVFKHIITPSIRVSADRPLVLVAHGCAFQMARVQKQAVVAFIRRRALHGKEGHLSEQGQFRDQLVDEAVAPKGSDVEDSALCSFYRKTEATEKRLNE